MAGAAGTGKSRATLEKLHMMALINPGMRGLILRKTALSLTASAVKTWERDVIREALADGSVWFYGGSAREQAQYQYTNGSSIALGGMDKPSKIMSTEYDVVYVQEATELSEDEWESITTRLRNGVMAFQQVIADCNPQAPTHWLRMRAVRGQTVMLDSRHEDNPAYFDLDGKPTPKGKAYIAKLDSLTGVRYLRLRKGIWAASEGSIYEEWSDPLHVVDQFVPPVDWPRFWSIDFGYTNPTVWQDWAQDPDGRLFLVREIYKTRTLVADHAAHIRRLHTDSEGRWVGPRPAAIICDHDAEDRATLTRELGMPTIAANKQVSRGIQAVAQRLRRAGDGRPRLLLMRDAVLERDQELLDAKRPASTQEEVPGYRWNADKDQPVKEDDHGCDAMRYLVAHLDLRSPYRFRRL